MDAWIDARDRISSTIRLPATNRIRARSAGRIPWGQVSFSDSICRRSYQRCRVLTRRFHRNMQTGASYTDAALQRRNIGGMPNNQPDRDGGGRVRPSSSAIRCASMRSISRRACRSAVYSTVPAITRHEHRRGTAGKPGTNWLNLGAPSRFWNRCGSLRRRRGCVHWMRIRATLRGTTLHRGSAAVEGCCDRPDETSLTAEVFNLFDRANSATSTRRWARGRLARPVTNVAFAPDRQLAIHLRF